MSASGKLPWQAPLWNRFQQQRQAGRLPHALLITGPAGLGKLALAERVAAQLLCRQASDDGNCGQCPACELVAAGSHPDMRRVTREEDSRFIRIDSVRKLTEFISMKSQYGGYRVGLVYPADSMSNNAANSLLKTLEEPPAGAMLILVSDRPSAIPATVRSRCQQATMPVPDRETAVNWLRAEAPELADRAAEMLSMAGGAPLQALAYAEQGIDQRLQELVGQLDGLAAGRVSVGELAGTWPKDEVPLLLALLPHLVQQAIRRRSGGAVEGASPDCSDGMGLRALHEYLAYVYNYRALADRALNSRLLVEDLFIRWQRISRRAA